MKKQLFIFFLPLLILLLSFLSACAPNPELTSEPENIVTEYPPENDMTVQHPELAALFRFEGDLHDNTGKFTSGSITGNRIFNTGGKITFSEGIRGSAAVFDGQSGIRLPDGLITDNCYSVAFWIKPNEITVFTTTFFGGISLDNQQSWLSFIPLGPINETMLWSGNSPWYDAPTQTIVEQDQWTHIAFSVDNGTVKVFLNGEERFYATGFPDIFSETNALFSLGVNYWDVPFNGMIDELYIFDSAVSVDIFAKLSEGTERIVDIGPVFRDVSVHDPDVIRINDTFYIFGSHLAAAKSVDLMSWQSIAGGWYPENILIPDAEIKLKEALTWPNPDAESTWAKSIIELNDLYYMYFSAAHWHSPRSNISLAVSENIEGPYSFKDILIKKYENNEYSVEAGEPFNYYIHPGVIDPHVFFDSSGRLQMVYGSFAGGMHILELSPSTGYPKPNQGYGSRIAGGNHAPMEGPFILYYQDTDYYYLFVSFGTLGPDGGYDIRVARSKQPEGPFYDPAGNRMDEFIEKNIDGRNWDNAEPYGAKLIGNFKFMESGIGYVSPGHNSVYLDKKTGKMYAIFHTRFPGRGHQHSVRIHQLFMNSKGWPVMSPHRYAGEQIGSYSEKDIIGEYQFINHGNRIQRSFGVYGGDITQSVKITLSADG